MYLGYLDGLMERLMDDVINYYYYYQINQLLLFTFCYCTLTFRSGCESPVV